MINPWEMPFAFKILLSLLWGGFIFWMWTGMAIDEVPATQFSLDRGHLYEPSNMYCPEHALECPKCHARNVMIHAQKKSSFVMVECKECKTFNDINDQMESTVWTMTDKGMPGDTDDIVEPCVTCDYPKVNETDPFLFYFFFVLGWIVIFWKECVTGKF